MNPYRVTNKNKKYSEDTLFGGHFIAKVLARMLAHTFLALANGPLENGFLITI